MPKPNPYRQLDSIAPELVGPTREPWMDEALCAQVDPDLFYDHATDKFENKPNGERQSAAKAVCATCPVSAECLSFALAHDERYGIWGGMTEKERRAMRRTA